jgi:hypothetical protein
MLYITQDYWVFGLFPSSRVLGSRNTTFRKVGLFSSSGERGETTPTQLGPLERVNLWTVLTRLLIENKDNFGLI